jgi:two-component system sensor histidine kinase QseC
MKSIANRLTLSQLAISVCAIFLFSLALYHYVENVVSEEMKNGLLNQANTLSQMVEIEKKGVDFEFDEFKFEEFDRQGATSSYFVFDDHGDLVAQSRYADLQLLEDAEPLKKELGLLKPKTSQEALESQYVLGHSVSPDGRYSALLLFSFYPKVKHSAQAPDRPWFLVVTHDQTNFKVVLHELMLGCMACGAAFILLNLAVQYWNIRKSLKPLRTMGSEAEKVSAERLDYRFSVKGLPEELQSIAFRLNDLLERLEASFVRERSFTTGAAHELRTPLAELKTIMQVGQGLGADDKAYPYFTDAESVILRMQSLMNALLSMTRSQPSDASTPFLVESEFDLVSLVREEWTREAARQSGDSFHPVEWLLPDSLPVVSDAGLLRGMVGNLLSNALEYADVGSLIQIRVSQQGRGADLEISNMCHHLKTCDVEQMTHAFWRKDASRSENTHHGLGLSLVKVYAANLGVDFSITRDESSNNNVVIMRISGINRSFNE